MTVHDDLILAIEEYKAILRMPDAEVCRLYNVDNPREIENIMLEEIELLNGMTECESRDYNDEYQSII